MLFLTEVDVTLERYYCCLLNQIRNVSREFFLCKEYRIKENLMQEIVTHFNIPKNQAVKMQFNGSLQSHLKSRLVKDLCYKLVNSDCIEFQKIQEALYSPSNKTNEVTYIARILVDKPN